MGGIKGIFCPPQAEIFSENIGFNNDLVILWFYALTQDVAPIPRRKRTIFLFRPKDVEPKN